MHGCGDDELQREMGTNRHVREETAMAQHQCALKIHGGKSNKDCPVQGRPKISSKFNSGNGFGVSTEETILLETLSSTSPTYMKYSKMRKLFLVLLYDYMYCSCSDHHFMKESSKQNTQLQHMGLNLRKENKGLKRRMAR